MDLIQAFSEKYQKAEPPVASVGDTVRVHIRVKEGSRERIQVEMTKLLKSAHPEKFRLFYETGITAILFPEFDEMMTMPQNNPYHCYSVGEHTLHTMMAVEADPVLRWTALLHDVGKVRTQIGRASCRERV